MTINKAEWMTSEEAAEYLRIPLKQLQNLASDERIPYYKFGNLNRYKTSELREMLLAKPRGVRSDNSKTKKWDLQSESFEEVSW